MWLWTIDDRLINTDLIQSIELYPNIPDDVEVEAFIAGEVEADYYEIVAVLASGDEALLYESEEEEQAQLAYSVLAASLALVAGGESKPAAPFSVQELLDEHRNLSN